MDDQKEIDYVKEPIKAYISEIQFNNGERLSVQENDIILFVGPNNAGKSQSLNDIYDKSGSHKQTVVVSDISVNKSDGSLEALVKKVSKLADNGSQYTYELNGKRYAIDKTNGNEQFKLQKYYYMYRDLFIAKLSTEARLGICSPVQIVDRDQSWTHPIHYAAFKTEYAKWLSDNFHKAFGNDLTANSLHGLNIPLCMGPKVKFDEIYENEQERQNAYADILEGYKTVNNQGDGIKSFTGILLYLMLDYYSTYLIDEPEAFLHPLQARIMGQIIGKTLRDNQQAFISTHSEEIIKGLLDVCENRLKIVRITREKDINSFSILDNEKVREVFGDPLLKYSNIMSSLFHKTVVLCESDSDCKLYSLIENHIKQSKGIFSETLYIHCGGKHRMARIAEALLSLNIDVRLIPDIDVLNDEKVMKNIAEAFNINWHALEPDYHRFVSGLHSAKETVNRYNAKNDINRIIDSSTKTDLSKNEIKQIQEIVRTISKWDNIKHGGKAVISNGEATIGFNNIDQELRKHKIYLVPVGEIEGFVREIGGHGPDWVNAVLSQYPNLDDEVYKTVKEFVEGIGL